MTDLRVVASAVALCGLLAGCKEPPKLPPGAVPIGLDAAAPDDAAAVPDLSLTTDMRIADALSADLLVTDTPPAIETGIGPDVPADMLLAPPGDGPPPDQAPPGCRLDERRCAADHTPEQCNASGIWTRQAPCANACTGAGVCGGDCKPDSKKCGGPNNLTIETCNDMGQWVAGVVCPNLCSSGTCGGSCMPSSKKCGANHTPETCSPQGTWEPQPQCQNICTGLGVCGGSCRPGTKRCGGPLMLTQQSCGLDGEWTSGATCPYLCNGGDCAGMCTPGTRQCGANQTPETCNPNGQWIPGTRCQFVCSGNGDCGVCMPNDTRCRNGGFERCDNTGNWASANGDCTAPTVVSVSPTGGATGVRSDAKIVITFNEPMDRTATQAAFASADIPSRTFSWDSSGTILTVTPGSALQYAAGANLSIAARSYAYSISTSASDLAGNRLQQAASASFTTLRRISTQFGTDVNMTGHFGSDGMWTVADGYAFCQCSINSATPYEERSVITFNMASLPAGIVAVETAQANLVEQPPVPPPATLGMTRIQFSIPTSNVFNSAGTFIGTLTHLSDRYVISNAALAQAVFSDYMNRASFNNRTQYRIAAVTCTAADESCSFNHEMTEIALTFLVP